MSVNWHTQHMVHSVCFVKILLSATTQSMHSDCWQSKSWCDFILHVSSISALTTRLHVYRLWFFHHCSSLRDHNQWKSRVNLTRVGQHCFTQNTWNRRLFLTAQQKWWVQDASSLGNLSCRSKFQSTHDNWIPRGGSTCVKLPVHWRPLKSCHQTNLDRKLGFLGGAQLHHLPCKTKSSVEQSLW